MSAATPAPIWWCEEHLASGWGGGRAKWCHLAPATDEKSDNYACRVVQRRLVPESALVVERDADGNWPLSILDAIGEKVRVDPWLVQAVIEDALELSDTDSCKAPEAST